MKGFRMKLFIPSLVISSLFLVLQFSGCASYKQLEPEPLLSPQEQAAYTEVKKGEKEFVVKQGKKYFIEFPKPADRNFYLVLDLPERQSMECILTSDFDRKNVHGAAIKDETHRPENRCVYPIENGMAGCFWLIEQVKVPEMVLRVKYRYVPQWRFKFENKYAEYLSTLKENMVNRQTFQSIGMGLNLDGFSFQIVLDSVGRHLKALQKVHGELLAIQSIFPHSILNSQDKAYLNYVALKKELEEEMAFQESYVLVLGFFKIETECRGNTLGLLENTENFIRYFKQKTKLGTNVYRESQNVMGRRLQEVPPFYDQLFAPKTDDAILDSAAFRLPSFYRLDTLFQVAELTAPPLFSELARFIKVYDSSTHKLAASKEVFRNLTQVIRDAKGMPADSFFTVIISKAETVIKEIPAPIDAAYGKYQTLNCVAKLNQDFDKIRQEGGRRLGLYRAADSLVHQLNAIKGRGEFPAMLELLKQKPGMEFLYPYYQDLDKLSVDYQAKNIKTALDAGDWPRAESGLSKLHQDVNYINLPVTAPVKKKAVEDLEDSLYKQVDLLTRERVARFCEEKIHVLENVDSLYQDSVFLPAYAITFSSGGRAELLTRQNELIAHLAKLKENEFPAKAVKLLYEEFLKDPSDNGVLKARAIVAHGKHYTGPDKEVAARMREVDPQTPKLITKPAEYRRVFVLPVTDQRTGRNQYFVRLNLQIASDAKFPVFDVNVKLPKEVASGAAEKQWYDKLLMNGKPLKNEGRFSIIAPTPSNNYECQITPLQMVKDGENYLDIIFDHKSFKVFSFSVMAQKPIIKKN